MINERSFRVKKNNEPYSNCYCTKPKLIENYDSDELEDDDLDAIQYDFDFCEYGTFLAQDM